jgi:DNA mismatch repair ATPase MutS
VLRADTMRVKASSAAVQYCVLIKGDLVKVRGYEGEIDYSVEVEETFARFKQGAVKDYRLTLAYGASMNHIEARILDLVAKLHPDIFASLDAFCAQHSAFVEGAVTAFDREIQFYVAYIEHMARIKRGGLKFCYPQVSATSKELRSTEGYDLALAHKLVGMNSPVITNNFHLQGPERIIVVSGPNQGGKTTFARTFGQLHYLASLGLPVPGRQAQLFLPDGIFTHFERAEDITNLRGKLHDDLVRIHNALAGATSGSIVIMNEIFSSTVLQDAVFLSQEIMQRIVDLDALGVWVTFIDEMASFSEQTVSMVSTIVPDKPAQRTFKIVRRPADGLAYAMSIAEKHGLTYRALLERIQP